MSERIEYNIDADALQNIGHTGIRRAVLFMGLGLNAAHRDDFNDYQLHKIPRLPGQTSFPMEFFPDDLPIERVKEFKEEFARWVVACGFREIIEHYALVLDQMHLNALIVLKSAGKLKHPFDGQKVHRKFQRHGVPEKIRELNSLTGMVVQGEGSISGIYSARNALTHDLGLVTAERAPSGELRLTWRAFDVFAKGVETGAETTVAELIGKATTEETEIFGRVVDREKVFKIGQPVRLTHQDLQEICWYFSAVILDSTFKAFVQFVKDNGVPETSVRPVKAGQNG